MAKRVSDRDRTKAERTMRDRETLGHLGGRIRLLREQRGLSQEKLAERAGLTSKFVGEVERLETNPSTTSIARLAAGLDVNVGDLFDTGNHLLPVPTTQLDHVQESWRSLGLAIEGLRSPETAAKNGGTPPRPSVSPNRAVRRLRTKR